MIGITRTACDAIRAHAREAAPAECCGLLVGRPGWIDRAVAARNLAAGTTRYVLDPAVHIRTRRAAREAGDRLLGFYHSHPQSEPIPSATDLDEASYPEAVYLIVGSGPSGPLTEIRAYRIEAEGRFGQVELGPGA